ncbi:MAG: CidA/LrgA family protein [Oscillospiraceae bacterium]|nr:CidA/LrgA family protein [Oscillospiraceae bacterium]
MKTFFQFGIICLVAFAGQIINSLVPLPVPGNVYGMVIMFLLLWSGVLKLHHVERAADMLLTVLPVMFLPSSVGIMDQLDVLWQNLAAVLLVCVVGTLISIIVSGRVTQLIRRKQGHYVPQGRRLGEDD